MNFLMPERIARLPKDTRGYPIPWNVLRGVDGFPIFTVNDDRKAWEALLKHLCPICGEKLGRWMWFVGGPRSAFDPEGWYIDLPGHHECIQFALAVCPYLAAPKYLGRIDVPDPSKLPTGFDVLLDETVISERPEVFVMVASNRQEVLNRAPLQPYVRPERPALGYEYWRHGRQIAESEAMPYLQAVLGKEWKVPEVAKL